MCNVYNVNQNIVIAVQVGHLRRTATDLCYCNISQKLEYIQSLVIHKPVLPGLHQQTEDRTTVFNNDKPRNLDLIQPENILMFNLIKPR